MVGEDILGRARGRSSKGRSVRSGGGASSRSSRRKLSVGRDGSGSVVVEVHAGEKERRKQFETSEKRVIEPNRTRSRRGGTRGSNSHVVSSASLSSVSSTGSGASRSGDSSSRVERVTAPALGVVCGRVQEMISDSK